MMADRVSRRVFVVAAGAGVTGVALAAAIGSLGRKEAKLTDRIVAARRDGTPPVDDPVSGRWLDVDPFLVSLLPQRIVPPFLDEAGVGELTVEAMHNGEELGFRLGWDDTVPDDLDGINRFHDAVAVQLPAQAGKTPPPVMMGGPGFPVHLLQWRASWQRDLEGRRQSVEALYPRVVRDEPPEKILPPEVAALFYVARVVDNPLSALERESSVEEIVAEGFGSVTALPEQRARGNAVHEQGRWAVTIGVPMERGAAGARLDPGSIWPVAFAVWLGSNGDRGSRKQYADWVSLELEA